MSKEMYDETTEMGGYEQWSPDQLADYFETKGLADYREVLIDHRIVSPTSLSCLVSLNCVHL